MIQTLGVTIPALAITISVRPLCRPVPCTRSDSVKGALDLEGWPRPPLPLFPLTATCATPTTPLLPCVHRRDGFSPVSLAR